MAMLTTKNRAGQGRRHIVQAMWRMLIFTALALGLVSCGPPGPRALIKGRNALEHGRAAKAVSYMKSATELMPTNAVAWNYLGLAYHSAGQPVDALKAYNKALSLNVRIPEARYNIGCLQLEQNQLQEARLAFTAYTLENDRDPQGFLKLGVVSSKLNDLAGAEKAYQRVLKLRPEDPEALTSIGLIRQKRGRAVEAVEYFQRALKADAQYEPALLNYAIVAQQSLKDRRLALNLYQQYLALKPVPANAEQVRKITNQLTMELSGSTAAQAARPEAQPAASRVPTAPAKDSRSQTGANKAQTASTSSPGGGTVTPANTAASSPSVQQPTAVAPRQAPSEAARQPVAEKGPAATRPLESGSSAAITSGSVPTPAPVTSTPAASRYTYTNPPRPKSGDAARAESFFQLALQARRQQRISESLKLYQQAVSADPSYFAAYFNIAVAQAEAGSWEAAARTYETALAIRPESVDARYNFALALKQLGYTADCIRELEKLTSISPKDVRVRISLANLYVQQKRSRDAREQYTRALEADPTNSQASAIRAWLADPRN